MMPRCLALISAAALASACGQTVVSQPTAAGAPSEPQTLQAATCSNDAPTGFAVEPRNGNAYLSWDPVESAEAYEVEIHEVESGSRVVMHSLRDTRWEWGGGPTQGPYRARVRAVSPCGMSDWSGEDTFILNRSGSVTIASAPQPPAPPAAAPQPPAPAPVPPAPPTPPPAPLLSCGTLRGQYVVDLLGTTFQQDGAPVVAPLALAAGTYRIEVETNDAHHAAGVQTYQTEEVVTVWGVGTTIDIPEAVTRQVTTFTATLPMLAQIVVEPGRHSVHGVCIAITPM